ncbi:hypothetical protein MMC08_007136 [Hypocenomyce scalaris]|nr:hypothetical protein [Hypocenomyce scalaris]
MPAIPLPSHLALPSPQPFSDPYQHPLSRPITWRKASLVLFIAVCIWASVVLIRRWRKRQNQVHGSRRQKVKEDDPKGNLQYIGPSIYSSRSVSQPLSAANSTTPPAFSSSSLAPSFLPHPSTPSTFPNPTIRRHSYPLDKASSSQQEEDAAIITASQMEILPGGILRRDTLIEGYRCRRHVLVLGGGSGDAARFAAECGVL